MPPFIPGAHVRCMRIMQMASTSARWWPTLGRTRSRLVSRARTRPGPTSPRYVPMPCHIAHRIQERPPISLGLESDRLHHPLQHAGVPTSADDGTMDVEGKGAAAAGASKPPSTSTKREYRFDLGSRPSDGELEVTSPLVDGLGEWSVYHGCVFEQASTR